MRHLLFLLVIPLVACGTPRERCIASVTNDLRVLDRLIETSKGNLQRGYALETQQYVTTEFQACGIWGGGYGYWGRSVWCDVNVVRNETVEVAINLNEEAAKLKTMEAKRRHLAKQAPPAIAQCEAFHPQ